MAYQLGTAEQTALRQGAELKLKDVQFPEGKRATRVRLRGKVQVKNTSGAGQDLTVADCLDVLRSLFDTISITFGLDRKKRRTWMEAVELDLVRELMIKMEGRNILFTKYDGTEVRASVANLAVKVQSAAAAGFADGATYDLEFEIAIPFIVRRLGVHRHEWCQGTTAMRQMEIVAKRGSGFASGAKVSGKFEQPAGANLFVRFLADTIPGDDEWHDLPYLDHRPNSKDRKTVGSGGRLLGVWERTTVGATPTIGQFTLDGELDDGTTDTIHIEIDPTDVTHDSDRENDTGDDDLNDLATDLYVVPDGASPDDLPVARRWNVKQIANQPVELDLVFLVAPIQGDDLAEVIATNLPKDDAEVKLSRAVTLRREDAPATSAGTGGYVIKRKGGVEYPTLPGEVVAKLGNGLFSRTPDLTGLEHAKVQAAAGNAAAADEAQAHVIKAVESLIKKIPGDVSITRSSTTQVNRAPVGLRVKAILPQSVVNQIK